MRYFLLFIFSFYTLLASTSLKTINSQDYKNSVLLSAQKEPVLLVGQVYNIYGSSLSQNTQTVSFEIENLMDFDINETIFSVKLFDKNRDIIIDKIEAKEVKKVFISFSHMKMVKNSQKEIIDITLKDIHRSWNFSQEVTLNKGVFKVYFPNIKSYESVELLIDGFSPRVLNKRETFLIPIFSNRQYTFKILKKYSNDPIFFEIDKQYLFSSNNDVAYIAKIFDFSSNKISSTSKQMYNLSFKIPELFDLKSKMILEVDTNTIIKKKLDDETEIEFDSNAYNIYFKKDKLIIEVLKKTSEFVFVNLKNRDSIIYSFLIPPAIKRTYNIFKHTKKSDDYFLALKNVKIYDEFGKNIVGLIKKESVIESINSTKNWITYKDNASLKKYRIKKDNLFAILGDNRVFVKTHTNKRSPIRVIPSAQQVDSIPARSDIDGYIRHDGWIEYINTFWWIHASSVDLELDFIMRPNYLLRSKPYGSIVSKSKEYQKIKGRYINKEWIKISGFYDKSDYHLSNKDMYIHNSGLEMLYTSHQ